MGIYHKKLHIRKNEIVISHNLYTGLDEVGANALHLRDGGRVVYAALGGVGDANASPLRVRKNGIVYAVLQAVAAAPAPMPTPSVPVSVKLEAPARSPNITVLSDCAFFPVPTGCRKILLAPVNVPGHWWKTQTVRLDVFGKSKCVVIDLPWDGAQVCIVNPTTGDIYVKDRLHRQTSSITKSFIQLRDVVYRYPPGRPPHNGEQKTCSVWAGMEINPQNISMEDHQWNHVKASYAVYWGADINGLTN